MELHTLWMPSSTGTPPFPPARRTPLRADSVCARECVVATARRPVRSAAAGARWLVLCGDAVDTCGAVMLRVMVCGGEHWCVSISCGARVAECADVTRVGVGVRGWRLIMFGGRWLVVRCGVGHACGMPHVDE